MFKNILLVIDGFCLCNEFVKVVIVLVKSCGSILVGLLVVGNLWVLLIFEVSVGVDVECIDEVGCECVLVSVEMIIVMVCEEGVFCMV